MGRRARSAGPCRTASPPVLSALHISVWRQANWEPPVDVLETDHEVLVIAALPGVAASEVQAIIDGTCLMIAGQRVIPEALRVAAIHRMELPHGRFERRIPLPGGSYDRITQEMINGCLVISLNKRAS